MLDAYGWFGKGDGSGIIGETLDEPCGNCDNCLTPAETWDASIAAQKALSCVHRTGQRFGVSYLADVLTGKNTERILQFGFIMSPKLNQSKEEVQCLDT